MSDYDTPWKEALERYFSEFMAFFFPQSYEDIDWNRGYIFLDKELQQVVRDAELGRRLVDKLVRVYGKDGEEDLVLVHIEVQGQDEKAFAERMYVYNYRLSVIRPLPQAGGQPSGARGYGGWMAA
ncbi:hypothetical protein [Nitrosococcus wardiae]|uniref:hypothetical protein n=1 Tax=Nitrosococcus wardiae TaxID=1814290 RepID=UPI001981C75C|nr:hypothetical protein [Nitrosococcus wardiae]